MPPVEKTNGTTKTADVAKTDVATVSSDTVKTDVVAKKESPNRYTDANRRCSTIVDKKTKATCDLFPADHSWIEPEVPAKNEDETPTEYRKRLDTDVEYNAKREEAQFIRGKPLPHFGSACTGYTDDPDREPE